MHAIVGEFLVKNFNDTSASVEHVHDPSLTKALVLVEHRPSYWLKYVVANALEHNPGFNLYVFGSPAVFDILDEVIHGTYVKCTLPPGFRSAHDFSKLLLSRDFWTRFYEDQILVFQLDCAFVRPIRKDLFAYDFIGPVCGSFSENHFIINGGLSLRNRRAMITALDFMDDATKRLPEDVAFTLTMRSNPTLFTLPTMHKCNAFAIETIGDPGTATGIHGTDKGYTPDGILKAMFEEPKQKSAAYNVAFSV